MYATYRYVLKNSGLSAGHRYLLDGGDCRCLAKPRRRGFHPALRQLSGASMGLAVNYHFVSGHRPRCCRNVPQYHVMYTFEEKKRPRCCFSD